MIIDGKVVAKEVRELVKSGVSLLSNDGKSVCLAVVLVGDDPASDVYVKNKSRDCEEVGIISKEYRLKAETTREELLSLIDSLNKDDSVDGILVQLPLPKHLDDKEIINAIDQNKDVDAFHPSNVGKIMIGDYTFLPCTPAGVIELLERYNIEIEGKNCLIIGRSNIVGKPMAMLMLERNATVTIAHSRTKNLAEISRNSDIIIVAIGRAKFLSADMVREGAVVIDVGINRDENGKLCGDADFEEIKEKASFITPVPGGVGPMTRAILMKNTLTAAKMRKSIDKG